MTKTEEFIIRANLIHGEQYNYSKVDYIDAHTKIKIICTRHGEFSQTPNSHVQGSGCRRCGVERTANSRRSNINEFVIKAREIHGEKYNYSKSNYLNTDKKITIICCVHGEFLQTPYKHLFGQGCSKCFGTFLHTTDEFIKKAVKIHGNRYDYSKSKYINANKQITIICPIHGEFSQTPSKHLTYKGCSKCSKTYQYNTEEWIQKAKKIHGDTYDYSKTSYTNTKSDITIICSIHGEFTQKPNSHLNGSGCNKCGKIYQYNTEEWIVRAKEVHGGKYDYSKTNYINTKSSVVIICPTHGEFPQIANSHISGYGCIKCSNTYQYTTEEFILKAKEKHCDKYDYSNTEYKSGKEKITIECKKHGEFKQNSTNHLKGFEGCHKCWKIKQHSKQQIEWLELISKLQNIKIQHAENNCEFRITNSRFRADGYCQETNTVYEFHGDYWHGNPKIYKAEEYNKTTKCNFGELYQVTIKKEEFIKSQGHNLKVMWESDWKKINSAVKSFQKMYRSKHQVKNY